MKMTMHYSLHMPFLFPFSVLHKSIILGRSPKKSDNGSVEI